MKSLMLKMWKSFNVPGFRKGKAPMSIIKRYYGETVFYEDAINICCDDTYPKALEEKEIETSRLSTNRHSSNWRRSRFSYIQHK